MLALQKPFSRAAGACSLRHLPKSTANATKHLRSLCPTDSGALLLDLPGSTTTVSAYRSTLPLWPWNTRPIRYLSVEDWRRPSHWRGPGPKSGPTDCSQTWTHRWGGPHPGPTPRRGVAGIRHSASSRPDSQRGTRGGRAHFRKGPAATGDLAWGARRCSTPGPKEIGRCPLSAREPADPSRLSPAAGRRHHDYTSQCSQVRRAFAGRWRRKNRCCRRRPHHCRPSGVSPPREFAQETSIFASKLLSSLVGEGKREGRSQPSQRAKVTPQTS